MAEEPVTQTGLELEVETEVVPEGDPNPVARGKKASAAEMSAYFDEIFGTVGQWLAYTFSNNRPIESGNLDSSFVFMSGDRAAFLGDQHIYQGPQPHKGNGHTRNPDKPLGGWDVPEDYDGPRIEIKSRTGKDSTAKGIIKDSFFRPSKAAIDRYFSANVVRTHKIATPRSTDAETQRSKLSGKSVSFFSASEPAAASFAIQAVPEPSAVLFCGFTTMMFAWRRRRADSK